MRHGGQILIDQLTVHGCEVIYCVPGESFLPALDGLYDHDDIATIVCRHEGGASMMAEAHGKLTGSPGIAFVTRGPGAANAASGIFVAHQDSTPLILFVGLQQRDFSDREAFQEIDLSALYGGMAKWVATINDVSRIPEYVSRAYHLALSGRPGPVVLGLPEDMLYERLAIDDAAQVKPAYAHISNADVELIASALNKASRPIMIVGGPNWNKTIQSQIEKFAERFQLPVGAAFRCQGYFDNRHDNYCGHFGRAIDANLADRIDKADLVLALGLRLDETSTGGFSYLKIPSPEQFLIHITPAPEESGRICRADLPIVASSASVAYALSQTAIKRDFSDREAFQEIDLSALYGGMAKWVATINDVSRIPEYVSRAYHLALSGRPGPVVLGLPEDMLYERLAIDDAAQVKPAYAHISNADVELIASALNKASRPIMIVGGPNWNKTIQSQIEKFAERFQLPVGAAFRCQGYFDNRHDNYCGHFGRAIDANLADRIDKADLVLALGLRLDETSTGGFSYLKIPSPEQFLIHITPAPEESGRICRADLPIVASSASVAYALSQTEPDLAVDRSDWCRSARQDYLENIKPVSTPGRVKFEQVVKAISEMLKDDAIITSGAGNYTTLLHRYFQHKGFGTQLAPIAGSMGYGLPAAIAAKLKYPDNQVVAFAGDGCLMMTVQELATAQQFGLDMVVIVVNNGKLGTIETQQKKSFPGRVIGTRLSNPDFQSLALSFGARVELVEDTLDFRPAFKRALDHDGLALIELRTEA